MLMRGILLRFWGGYVRVKLLVVFVFCLFCFKQVLYYKLVFEILYFCMGCVYYFVNVMLFIKL